MKLFPVPEVAGEVDSAVDERYALVLQEGDLFIHASEGEGGGRLAEAVDHAVARNVLWIGVHVQGIADDAAPMGIAREHRDLSVGRDLAVGDAPDNIVDQFK